MIDPKKIEEWKALVQIAARVRFHKAHFEGPGGAASVYATGVMAGARRDPPSFEAMLALASNAPDMVAALLSEREEMQREIERLRSAPRVVGVTQDMRPEDFDPMHIQFVPVFATDADARLSEALAVLRSVEWAGATGYDDGAGAIDVIDNGCPVCHRQKWDGHAPDCRLAALLRGA